MRSLIVLLGVLFSGVGTAQELRVRDIEPVGILSSAGAGALAMPTDVAIGAAGRLYVVDGGNNRIVIYSPDGDYIKSVGREGKGNLEFAGPIGIGTDTTGHVYVADSGNHRIQVLDTDGGFVRAIGLVDGQVSVRPVDVAVSEISGDLFVTCNNTHKVMKLSSEGKVLKTWGGEGTTPDRFRYPATIAVRQGKVAVVDVLNTRVQVFDEKGDLQYQLGEWGVLPGQLFRPKGVAFDGFGNFYVSDSYTEVVQVFDSGYEFKYVLGNNGVPRRFVTPVGLAVSQDERIYVTEMLGNRVSEFALR